MTYTFFIVGLLFSSLLGIVEDTHARTLSIVKPQIRQWTPPTPLSPMEQEKIKRDRFEQAVAARKRKGLSVDRDRMRVVKSESERQYKPQRNYEQQSCYHMVGAKDPVDFTYCDANRCTFEDGQYCEHKSRNCYDANGTLIVNEKGESEIDYDKFTSIKWDMCLTKEGALVTPKGEKSFDEKIQTGCGYRVGKSGKYLEGYIAYMMTCDKYRCLFHPGAGSSYNRETKMFIENGVESLTPPYEYAPYLTWKCLNGKQANRVSSRYRCSVVVEDGENWGCQVCFENGKHVYKSCIYTYNEKGEINGTRVRIGPELQGYLDDLAELRYAYMNAGRGDGAHVVGELEVRFRQTPTSNTAQKKIVALLEDFFDRKGDGGWSIEQQIQEVRVLRGRIYNTAKIK